jgi:hypothetical protein
MAPNWTPVPHTQPESRWVVDISRPIREGGFGIVYRGRDRGETGEEAPKDCAAKKLGLATQQEIENFQKERAMLQRVGRHGSIIELYGSVEAPEAATGWLFLEMATGGELYDHLIDEGRLNVRIDHRPLPAADDLRRVFAAAHPSKGSACVTHDAPALMLTASLTTSLGRCGMALRLEACQGRCAHVLKGLSTPRP